MKNKFSTVKYLSLFFAFVLCATCIGLFSNGNVGSVNADAFLKTQSSSYFSGAGTQQSPYLISQKEHIDRLAQDVNGGEDYQDKYFVMTEDIDMEGMESAPIGDALNPFMGIFDGAGYTISNFTQTATTSLRVGLFGNTKNATITSVGLKEFDISGIDLTSETETEVCCGGIVAYAESTLIESCFVQNTVEEKDIVLSSYLSVYAGGIVGRLTNGSQVQNCFSNINILVDAKTSSNCSVVVGGIVGFVNNSQIKNVYSCSVLSSKHTGAQNLGLIHYIGGILGYVQGSYSNLVNSFYVGKIVVDNPNDSGSYVKGGIIGSITPSSDSSAVPQPKSLNYCYYYLSETNNSGVPLVGSLGAYSLTNVMFQAKEDLTFFKTTTTFSNSDYYDLSDAFDFNTIWLIEDSYPVLQLFAYYVIEIEQTDNCVLELIGGEEVSETSKRYKAGTEVIISCNINAEVSRFYNIKTWRKNQTDIESSAGRATFSFECSYITKGKYTVILQPNKFTLKITIPTDSRSIASIGYETSNVGSTFQTQLFYGREVTVEAILGSSEDAQNYAFEGWYSGLEADNRIDWESPSLTFSMGDSEIPFDDTLTINLTPKFTRDICRFTLEFDSSMGDIKLFSTDEFSGETVSNKPIKMGQSVQIEAQAKEGYEFLGWFALKDDPAPITKSTKLDEYVIENDSQYLFAKFAEIGVEDEAKDGLSGWAIFGIVAGCLAAVGISLLIVFLVKRKGSYKAKWNF